MKLSSYMLQIKLVFSLVIFTFLLAGVITTIEIQNQYNDGIDQINSLFQRVRTGHISTLAQNLWRFDERSIELELNSICNDIRISGVVLTDNIRGERHIGETSDSSLIITYPVILETNGDSLGSLTLFGTDTPIRNQIRTQIPRTILSEITKMISASLFLLILFYLLFGRHLNKIISYADSLSLENIERKLELYGHRKKRDPDELERLAIAINHMTDRIQEDFVEKQRTMQLIEIKNRELEQIVYVSSHDMRSPLVNVDGYGRELEYSIEDIEKAIEDKSSVVSDIEALLPDMKDALYHIRNSTKQMDTLQKGLLVLSRNGRSALNVVTLDMNKLMERVLSSMNFEMTQIGAEIDIRDMPPCRGDEMQISQVFSNLIGNAIKYRSPDRTCKISICGKSDEREVRYCVEDNGIGIAPEHQEIVFELFHRLNPSETQGEGLGLTLVRQILGRLNGTITVDSVPGEYTKFHITLPAVKSETVR